MEDNKLEHEFESPDIFADSEDFMDINLDVELPPVESWRGAPLVEIYGGNSPWVASEFPIIAPSYNHAVLYNISKNAAKSALPPEPQQGRDIWETNYVRMPHSSQNLYPVEEGGKTILKNRWTLVEEALSKPIQNSYELESAILYYNSKYKRQWRFHALHKLFNEYLEEEETDFFFRETLPQIINLVLKLPEIVTCAIPLLRQEKNSSVSLSQWQIASLLANAFFCTFPRRNSQKAKSEYSTFPDINFNRLFQSGGSKCVLEKIKCICHYFRRVCTDIPTGVLTFTRHYIDTTNYPDWSKSSLFIGSIPLHVNANGTIEDEGVGLLQVDFANKFLGGGVLGHGCVQEEIRFVICPELLVSMLFTEVLKPNEALLMIGCERFSNYEGYADTFKWSSNHVDTTERDSSGRLRCAIVAIDALRFSRSSDQYRPELITRDLNKAFAGFSIHADRNKLGISYPGVATGNWGCGAFCGSPHLKALIQLMVCCISRRPMVYYTFNDVQLRDEIINMYNFLSQNNITVGTLYTFLRQFNQSAASSSQLYSYLIQACKDRSPNESKISQKMDSSASPSTSKDCKSIPTAKSFFSTKLNESVNKIVSDEQKNVEKSYSKDPENTLQIVESSEFEVTPDSSEINSQPNSKLARLESNSSTADAIIQSPKNSLFKKKTPLGFLERYTVKSADDNGEKKTTVEAINEKEKTSHDDKSKGDAKKTGKISDYFQRLQKH